MTLSSYGPFSSHDRAQGCPLELNGWDTSDIQEHQLAYQASLQADEVDLHQS